MGFSCIHCFVFLVVSRHLTGLRKSNAEAGEAMHCCQLYAAINNRQDDREFDRWGE